uniref:Uncharacterized protein n=1 Tax=Sphaerodactylus townsendi TaxID=933632 RepID=A0ACB8EVL8_9SAUR
MGATESNPASSHALAGRGFAARETHHRKDQFPLLLRDNIPGSRDGLDHHHPPSHSNSDELELTTVGYKPSDYSEPKLPSTPKRLIATLPFIPDAQSRHHVLQKLPVGHHHLRRRLT